MGEEDVDYFRIDIDMSIAMKGDIHPLNNNRNFLPLSNVQEAERVLVRCKSTSVTFE